jgi:type IV pilus assembly protein PilN
MRISINLASRPFVELRPLFARLRIAMAGLTVLAVGLGFALHHMTVKAHAEEAQMHELKVQTSVIENERLANETRMHEPQNRAVLERSKFLNELFAEKSFSWTSVMMDLENVLPGGVQVTSIDPVITNEHDVNIRLRVSGDRDRAVELVHNLEHSRRFLTPRPANETAQTQEPGKAIPIAMGGVPGGVEFDIMSGYNPLPATGKDEAKKDAESSPEKQAEKTAISPVHKAAIAAGPAPAKKPPAQPHMIGLAGQANKPPVAGGGR